MARHFDDRPKETDLRLDSQTDASYIIEAGEPDASELRATLGVCCQSISQRVRKRR
jgi:hypothetical protein